MDGTVQPIPKKQTKNACPLITQTHENQSLSKKTKQQNLAENTSFHDIASKSRKGQLLVNIFRGLCKVG